MTMKTNDWKNFKKKNLETKAPKKEVQYPTVLNYFEYIHLFEELVDVCARTDLLCESVEHVIGENGMFNFIVLEGDKRDESWS